MKMQKVSLPPLRSGIHINSVTQKEPSRSWSRYKKLLIDNPKDSNLLQRQKLWNFQKVNRGAFRSKLASLPDIPYRVHSNLKEKVSVGVQTDISTRVTAGLRVIFPSLTGSRRPSVFNSSQNSDSDEDDDTAIDKACSPMHSDLDKYGDDFEETSSVEDPGFEFDYVLKKKNAGTMTEEKLKKKTKKKKSVRMRNKERGSILLNPGQTPNSESGKKNVTFAYEQEFADIATQTPEVPEQEPPKLCEVEERAESVEKLDLDLIETTRSDNTENLLVTRPISSELRISAENVGHSSRELHDPLSVLDILSGGQTCRYRNVNTKKRGSRKNDNAKKLATDPDADRVWFEKIVGDKEVIDAGTYASFERTRHNNGQDTQSDSNTDRYTDFSKAYARKNFTPRINDEFPQYHSVLAKDKKVASAAASSGPRTKHSRRGMMSIGKSY